MSGKTSTANEIVIKAAEIYKEWSQKLFWKRRLPGFRDTSKLVRHRIHELSKREHRRGWWSDNQYIGLNTYPILLDLFVLQVQKIREAGLNFDITVIYHPGERKWVSDGGKRDNWETFKDCHTEQWVPEWLEFRLSLDPELYL
jgi:hypothetical protein